MKRKAQSTIEYAILILVVAAAVMAMRLYVQRAVQANLFIIEAHINEEAQADY